MIPRVCLQCRLRLRTAASINPSRFVAARLYSSGRRDVLGTYEQLLDTTDALRSPELSKLSHSKHDKQSERAAQLLQDLPPFLKAAHAKLSYPDATHRASEVSGKFFKDDYVGQRMVIHGFLARGKRLNKTVASAFLFDSDMYHHTKFNPDFGVRVISQLKEVEEGEERPASTPTPEMHKRLYQTHVFAPVVVQGTMQRGENNVTELVLEELWVVNDVKSGLIYSTVPEKTNFSLRDRHLQLRTNGTLWHALRTRHKILKTIRRVLDQRKFLEVETPLLFKSTPEGAREFLVPTRWSDEHNQPQFYALPQSPQQYKQMLMASGVNKYYQIARCFRDEDLRADRQPEFTQLDMEMQWAKPDDIMTVIEGVIRALWHDVLNVSLPPGGFKKLTYPAAMMWYGSDKPDTRFGKIQRITYKGGEREIHGFVLYPDASASPETIASVHADLVATHSKNINFKSYIANESTANGVPEHELSATDIDDINEALSAEPNSIVVLWRMPRVYPFAGGSTPIGELRRFLIEKGLENGIIRAPASWHFLWVTEFPLFTPTSKAGLSAGEGQQSEAGISSTHHPFTAPHEDDFHHFATDPLKVRAQHYDLVLNGVELGGGSRRIHDPELQRYILKDIIKVPEARLKTFEHLIDVLASGCPPHAGIALGLDRLVAILTGTGSLRDVIAFPKNKVGKDVCVGSPATVEEEQLQMLGIGVDKKRLRKMANADVDVEL